MEKEVSKEGDIANNASTEAETGLTATPKGRWERLWPVIACGAGLFSDGYLNSVIGQVNVIFGKIYGKSYSDTTYSSKVSAITFAGTVAGMLLFGYTSDKYSRKWSLMASTLIIIVFSILCAGAWGPSRDSLLNALIAYRFLLGIGIGGENPAGSVGAAESSGELTAGTRNRWFILFTNVQIDFGFVIGALIPMIVVYATTENHLSAAWRICLGIGAIPPLSLLWLRVKLEEPEAFKRESMRRAKTPYLLAFRFYGWRLLVVSMIWFLYNFTSYSMGIYQSQITNNLKDSSGSGSQESYPLWKSFGWSTLIMLFYLPGSIGGSLLSDRASIGPKRLLAFGSIMQGVIGYIMAGCVSELKKRENIGGFVVVYGMFLALGELGPGDNIGLVASKTCATSIRGQYYGIAAAMGKVGAFTGTYLYLKIKQGAGSDEIKQLQNPFWVASTLAILAGLLALFCLPQISQDTIETEDIRFREYLQAHGYDTSLMGEEVTPSNTVGPAVSIDEVKQKS